MPMRMYDLIEKKKEGISLSEEEIRYMIREYSEGRVPDYQMSAMLMAICFQGLDENETLFLTLAMRDSGDCMDLSGICGIKADKHSTGGVGDKTTLVLAPVLASLGISMAKMSGRGLGHTGGTIDKLECFPGFRAELGEEEFFSIASRVGLAISGQSKSLAPADKKLYALRDVTATVNETSLIASSIMSKKLASGGDIIVLDVKTGSGAFMKRIEDAVRLAETMVKIGKMAGKKMSAVITDMDQPLGNAVGNSLEVVEAVSALSGAGPADLMEVVYALGSRVLVMAGLAKDGEEAVRKMQERVACGAAKEKLAQFVAAQGGDASYVYDTSKFKRADYVLPVFAMQEGCVCGIRAQEIGSACMRLGGGRESKESVIDASVGITLEKKQGDYVKKGDALAYVHANDRAKGEEAVLAVRNAYTVTGEKAGAPEMIKAVF